MHQEMKELQPKLQKNKLIYRILDSFIKEISLSKTFLIVVICFFIFFTFLLILSVNQINNIFSRKVSYDLVSETSKRVEANFNLLFDASLKSIESLKQSLSYPSPSSLNEKEMLEHFRNELVSNPMLSGVYYGTASGDFYGVKKFNQNDISSRIVKRDAQGVRENWTHDNPGLSARFPSRVLPAGRGYDPRETPWYQLGVGERGLAWTTPYVASAVASVNEEIKITLVDVIKNEIGEVLGVVGFDYELLDLSTFLSRLTAESPSEVFIMNEYNDILAISSVSLEAGGSAKRFSDNLLNRLFKREVQDGSAKVSPIKPDDLPVNDVIKIFFDKYQEEKTNPNQNLSQNLSYSIENYFYSFLDIPVTTGGEFLATAKNQGIGKDGEDLALLKDASPTSGLKMKIGVIHPEVEFSQTMGNFFMLAFLSIIGVVLILALYVTGKFSSRFTLKLSGLAERIGRVRNFDLGVAGLEKGKIIEINQINDAYEGMRKNLISFAKFVPENVIKKIIQDSSNKQVKLEGKKKRLTILFTDIENFAKFTEENPDMIVGNMEKYFNIMTSKIHEYRGIIDKFIGESVMAFWEKDREENNIDLLACQSVIAIQKALKVYNHNLKEKYGIEFKTRFGINSGEALLGNLGASNRLNYSAIGDSVNLASQIDNLNKKYETEILISQSSYDEVRHKIVCRTVDHILVKGKKESVLIYQPMDVENNIKVEEFDFLKLYEQAFEFYQKGDWIKAKTIFLNALELKKDDFICKLHLKRCDVLIKRPRENWNGVFERRD